MLSGVFLRLGIMCPVTSNTPELLRLAKKEHCDINPRHFWRGHRPTTRDSEKQ